MRVVTGIVAMALASSAMAQVWNVDVNATSGAGAGLPALGYGAGAGAVAQTTAWVGVTSGTAVQGIGGGASLQWGSAQGLFGFNNAGTTGNDELLLDDCIDIGGTGASITGTVTGLAANQQYDVFVYAWAPDSATFITNVNIAGSGAQAVGGAWGGSNAQGVTFAKATVSSTAAGTLAFTAATGSGFGSLNGFQIVTVPAPAGIAMIGLAGLLGRRRRD